MDPRDQARRANHGIPTTVIASWDRWIRHRPALDESLRLDVGSMTPFLSDFLPRSEATIAVGTLIAERPPHRTVRAAFPHTACMGLSLSRGRHANLVVLCIPFFGSTRAASTLPSRPHISIAVAAQLRSRTALLQRRRRLVLDGREHGGRLPAIGWLAVR